MSLQRFNLVCIKAAVIGHIRTGRLTRRLPVICRRADAPATLDRRPLAGCSSGKRLLRAPADHFGGIVFREKIFRRVRFLPRLKPGFFAL